MDILQLLDRLETVLSSGSRIPMTNKTMVDEHECLDILDQMRATIPEEVKQAKRLYNDRDRVIHEAEERAERVMAHAREQAALMAQQHEIVKAAEARARLILQDADAEAAERRDGADRYASDTLERLERHLNDQLNVVRNGIRALSRQDYEDGEVDDEPEA
ncbi:MAG TPA: ATPase [Chloroflexota bacterium]